MNFWINKKTLTAAGIVIAVAWLGVGRPLPSLEDEESAQHIAELAYTKDGKLVPPTFSHESGFYPEEFELTLSHPDPDVTIYYTLDGSDPDPDNLDGSTFRYKNEYAQPPATEPTGEFLYQEYKTYKYTGPIKIIDRTYEPDRLSQISTTTHKKPTYFPSPKETNNNDKTNRKFLHKGFTIKAIAYKDKHLLSKIAFVSLFLKRDTATALPVISIIIPAKDLYDFDGGILVAGQHYENWLKNGYDEKLKNRRWWWQGNWSLKKIRKAAHLEVLNDLGLQKSQAKITTHGGATRSRANKTLRIYLPKSQPLNIFSDNIKSHRFLLRNAGNQSSSTFLADAALQRSFKNLNFGIQRYQPYLTYINGEYNGILNARDRRDAYLIKSIYSLPNRKIDHIKRNSVVVNGNGHALKTLNKTLEGLDSGSFATEITSILDINSFNDYFASEIFIGNTDWPGNNIAMWRYSGDKNNPTTPTGFTDGKWRWFMYDTDHMTGGLHQYNPKHNTVTHATKSKYFKNITKADSLSIEFVTRFSDLLNSWFTSPRINAIIDDTKQTISEEMPEHINRWSTPRFSAWEQHINRLKEFFEKRPIYQWQHLEEFFELEGRYQVQINTHELDTGRIQLNTLNLGDDPTLKYEVTDTPLFFPWQGQYFKKLPLTLEAQPAEGYKFSHWQVDGVEISQEQAQSQQLVLHPEQDVKITAVMTRGH